MLKNHFRRILIGIVLGLIAGGLYFQFGPKVYAAEGTVYLNDVQDQRAADQQLAEDVNQILGFGASQSAPTEVDYVRSENFFDDVLKRVDPTLLADPSEETTLYNMYTVTGDPGSKTLLVEVKAHDARTAEDIGNNIAVVYSAIKADILEKSYKTALAYLTQQLNGGVGVDGKTHVNGLVDDLNDVDRKLLAFRQANKSVDLTHKVDSAAANEAKLAEDLLSTQSQIEVLMAHIATENAKYKTRPQTQNPSFERIKSQAYLEVSQKLTELELQRAETLKTYNPDSATVKKIDQEINRVKDLKTAATKDQWLENNQQVVQDPLRVEFEQDLIKSDIQLAELKTRETATQRALNEQKATSGNLAPAFDQLTKLTRQQQYLAARVQRVQGELDDLKQKANPAATAQAAVTAGFDPANPEQTGFYTSPKPVSPILFKALPIGAAVGAFLALLISLMVESLRTTVRTSAELAEVLGLPVSATTPQLRGREAQARLKELPSSNFRPLESFRFMAARFALKQSDPKVVLFTSADGGVGCSSAAGEFALAAARMGVRTVLVDADLRSATLSKNFEVSDRSGVREIINRSMLPSPDNQITVPTAHANLSIVPAGSQIGDGVAEVPLSVLAGLIETIKEGKDLVVIDTPPCNVLADAARFVPFADEVLLVVSARRTKNTATLEAETLLRSAGAEIVSLVLTGTNPADEAFSRTNRYSA